MKYSAKDEQALMTELFDPAIANDLLRFVLFVYPWRKSGTPLAEYSGPRNWQAKYLDDRSQHLKDQRERMALDLPPVMWKHATASGRGPGKSALVSWLEHHMMTTCLGSTTIVTANTEPQLKSRTFAEIGKWLTLAVNSHWFEASVLSVYPAKWFAELIKAPREKGGLNTDTRYYYAQGQLWSEENPDAFAGAHNPLGMQVLMDEASGIPDTIFNVTQGFFTEPVLNRFWDVFSNPRRNSGAFYNCFHGSGEWRRLAIDSRTVEGIDASLFESMIREHGIDSYAVRVEVLGQFPRQGDRQFISNEAVHAAQKREVIEDAGAPLMMGVDVARFGDDLNVARFRQGNDARTIPAEKWQGIDLYATADRVAHLIDKYNPDGVCIDAGMGSGVVDILKRRGYRVHEIHFGGGASDPQWANKGTELYADIRKWLPGAALDQDGKLFTDLTARDYNFYGKAKDQMILEPKEQFKSRTGRSPDDGDALGLTFGVRCARRDRNSSRFSGGPRLAGGLDYQVLG